MKDMIDTARVWPTRPPFPLELDTSLKPFAPNCAAEGISVSGSSAQPVAHFSPVAVPFLPPSFHNHGQKQDVFDSKTKLFCLNPLGVGMGRN